MIVRPSDLAWNDLDPSRHPFDARAAGEVVASLGPARCVPIPPVERWGSAQWRHFVGDVAEPWNEAMTQALVEHYGPWASGWRWTVGEGDLDGGPVGAWCCNSHSFAATAEETLAKIAAALCEWRDWLESLARWFQTHPLDLDALGDQRILWDRTAHHLILHVADRTGHESAWYRLCHTVLAWFLCRWGIDADRAGELVERAVGGRFESWTAPDVVLVDDIADKLAGSLRPQDRAPATTPVPDHLQEWLAARAAAPWEQSLREDPAGPVDTAEADGALEDIRTFDGALDPARAEGLLAALELARADAARGVVLDFELLRTWQRHVLHTPGLPAFRTLPAFAKAGQERYGIGPDTRERFDACLADSAAGGAEDLPLRARAARLYLDVCYFHPFDDGNARVAFLAVMFLLAREGMMLESVRWLRRISRPAGDGQGAVGLARMLAYSLRPAPAPSES